MALYRIAGLTVDMPVSHELTRSRAARYQAQADAADVVLPRALGDAYEEYAELATAFYTELLRYDGFLVHASAVELDGAAFLFSATSGTGKSTHASYWVSTLGACVLNDDKPAVRRSDNGFTVYGTPFCGKNDISENRGAPLKAIAVLRRAPETRVEPLSKREALFCLLDQTIRPTDPALYERLLTLLEELLECVPVYAVYVPNDPASASAVHRALNR